MTLAIRYLGRVTRRQAALEARNRGICKQFVDGAFPDELAREYGLCLGTIYHILKLGGVARKHKARRA